MKIQAGQYVPCFQGSVDSHFTTKHLAPIETTHFVGVVNWAQTLRPFLSIYQLRKIIFRFPILKLNSPRSSLDNLHYNSHQINFQGY